VVNWKGGAGVPEMIEVDKGKFTEVLESLQRKVPRLCRLSFKRAFDMAIAIEMERYRKECDKLKGKRGMKYESIRERLTKRMEEQTAYLRSLQEEALEYYDGKKEEQTFAADSGGTAQAKSNIQGT
jgi:hypothetical protein